MLANEQQAHSYASETRQHGTVAKDGCRRHCLMLRVARSVIRVRHRSRATICRHEYRVWDSEESQIRVEKNGGLSCD